jgi:hypothetical protein
MYSSERFNLAAGEGHAALVYLVSGGTERLMTQARRMRYSTFDWRTSRPFRSLSGWKAETLSESASPTNSSVAFGVERAVGFGSKRRIRDAPVNSAFRVFLVPRTGSASDPRPHPPLLITRLLPGLLPGFCRVTCRVKPLSFQHSAGLPGFSSTANSNFRTAHRCGPNRSLIS